MHLKRARLYWILCLSVVIGSGGLRAAATEDATTASIPAYQTSLVYDSDGVLGLRDVQVLKHLTLFGKGQLLQLTNPVAVTQNGEVVRPLVGQRWDLGLSGAVGLFDVVHLGVYLPLTLFQNGEFPGLKVGEVAPVGFNDMRLGIKGKIPLPKSQPYELAVMSDVIIPSGNEKAYMGMAGAGWRNDVIAEYSLAGFGAVLNIGYQIQPTTEIYNIVDDDKLFYGLGGYARLLGELDAVATLNGWISATRPFYSATENGLEFMVGLRYRYEKPWLFEASTGLPVSSAYGVPVSRVSLGASYTYLLDLDRDDDGIPDYEDTCPDEPEDMDGMEDEDGCPDLDTDGDGLKDELDGCPEEAEDKDDFEDEDGCPEPDNDEDGLLDSEDECPNEPEDIDDHKDHDGCLDEDDDQDDVDNKDDKCPDKAEDIDGFEDEDGCPDEDNDQDGILDADDKCPLKKEDVDEFEDDDGCPDEDNDQDGIFDANDKCPFKAETFNEFEDDDGCPDQRVQMVMIERDKIVIPQKIHFASGNNVPMDKSRAIIEKVAELLVKHPEVKLLEIQGHTDIVGKKEYNLKLSQARAEAIKDMLVSLGVDASRLIAKGYGPEKLIDYRKTKKAHYHNRRVEFVVLEMEELQLSEEEAKLYEEERARQRAIALQSAVEKAQSEKSNIKTMKVGLRDGKMSIHIQARAPISELKTNAKVGKKGITIEIKNAKLGKRKKTFSHRGVKATAKQVKKDVQFTLKFKRNFKCKGKPVLKSSSKGIRILSECPKVPRAVRRAAQKKAAAQKRIRSKRKGRSKRGKIRNKKRKKPKGGRVTTETE
ncbi:MAG: hypothetical protein CMH56_16595 [Myxococcales bacterium]|nr:hypothetical protein [Myxococcales bacterium]